LPVAHLGRTITSKDVRREVSVEMQLLKLTEETGEAARKRSSACTA
jgi:hypothetical protein